MVEDGNDAKVVEGKGCPSSPPTEREPAQYQAVSDQRRNQIEHRIAGLKEDRAQGVRRVFQDGAKRRRHGVTEAPVRACHHRNEEDPVLLALDALMPDEMRQEPIDTERDKKGKSGNEENGIHMRMLCDGRLLLYARILRFDQGV